MFTKANREILVHNDSYAISKIIESDREEYTELQRQINGEATLFLNPLSKEIMWDFVLSDKGLFIILDKEMNFCGSVELNGEPRTPEIGISILEKYRNKGIAKNAIDLLMRLTYDPENIDYYLVRIKIDNTHSIHVFEKMGAVYLGEEKSTLDCFKKYLKKNNWEEKHMEELSDLYSNFEDNSRVIQYKLDPTNRI